MPDKPIDPNQHASWEIVSQAYAQSGAEHAIKQFSLPDETVKQQVFRGLFGSLPRNIWFVIAGSQLTEDGAEQQAKIIRGKGFAADVYAPYGGNPYYAVVIGSQLTIAEARALKRKAVAAGLAKGTYLWTMPKR